MAPKRQGSSNRQLGFDALWGAAQAKPEAGEAPATSRVEERRPATPPPPPDEAGRTTVAFSPPIARRSPEPALLELAQALRLERNLALAAGAGTGKTYSLVSMCLHVLGGARRDHAPVECARLGLLTFTDKAAGEMRERLRERLGALAEGRGEEPDLRQSFEVLGAPFPPQRFWREARDGLGSATIGTFHSLCSQLLRRAPPGFSVNPAFELLDDREAKALVVEIVERVVLGRLEAGSPELGHLVGEFGFGGGGSAGLVDALVPVYSRIREEGLSPRFVTVADGALLKRQYDSARRELEVKASAALAQSTQHRDRLEDFARLLERLTFENTPELVPRLRAVLGSVRQEHVASLKPFVKKLERGDEGREMNLPLLHGACVMAPHEAVVREVLGEIEVSHRELLARRGVLDFTGLLVQARDLLRDSLVARRAAHARFGALLVDEFQDTNRLQLELVLLLAERREGAPRPVSTAFEAQHQEILELPLEPAFTAVVGDRKQSIYEFRGADVSVFATMSRRLEGEGGGTAYLKASRRSSPALTRALNSVMTKVLGKGGARWDFDVGYSPAEDDLTAVRTSEPPGKPLIRLQLEETEGPSRSAEAQRLADAEAVARFLASRLSDPSALVISREGGAPRRMTGGDVAMLFQRFTQLELYRQALVRHGVRHRVVRGRGFWGAQEVVDVACLFSLLSNPDDAVAFAAVIRSPFVGLSDTALVELGLEAGRWKKGLHPSDVLVEGRRPDTASELERERLERFVRTFAVLAPEPDRLGLTTMLEVALERTGFKVAVAASPFGEQALANLDKLLELAARAEAGGTSRAAFAAQLLELADTEPGEAQGEVIDALDPLAVTVCTVHQAKGLEWPVVVLPDLSGSSPSDSSPVRFDRLAGLGVKPPATDEGELQSLSIERIAELRQARATAERLRLLYVAMTRARDRVVLGLFPPKPRAGTWAADLGTALEWADVRAEVEDVQVDRLVAVPPDDVEPRSAADALDDARQVVARVREAPRAETRLALLPVTQLMDFALCPKRYHWAHQVGLSEGPRSVDGPVELEVEGDVRERGTAAHRLLELAPLDLEGDRFRRALQEIRRAEGLGSRAGEDVLDWVTRLFSSDFGRRLRGLGEARVHRELPFVLGIRDGGSFRLLLRGQIDLLIDDEVLTVVDYKASRLPPCGLAAYRFQLRCYALAATRFAGRDVAVRAGVAFLRETDPRPHFLEEPLELEGLKVELLGQARALVKAQASGLWPTRPPARCGELGCGFVDRCYGPGASGGS